MSAQFPIRAADRLLRWPRRWTDRRRNAGASGNHRILIAHNAVERPVGFRDFSHWTAANLPELRKQFEFRLLPCESSDLSRYAAVVFWGGATLVSRASWLYRAALDLAGQARAAGIPLLHSADFWPNAVPSRASKLIAAAGFRTPRIWALQALVEPLRQSEVFGFPLSACEDSCRPQQPLLVRNSEELAVIHGRFRRPIAVELLETGRETDRLLRTYRYLAVGEVGISRSLLTQRVGQPQPAPLQQEFASVYEAEFVAAPNPHHAAFQEIRHRLGFDVAAFDYAYDRTGQMVILRADPFPDLNYSSDLGSRHTRAAVERTFAALARLYLQSAGMAVPSLVEEILADLPENVAATPKLRIAVAA